MEMRNHMEERWVFPTERLSLKTNQPLTTKDESEA